MSTTEAVTTKYNDIFQQASSLGLDVENLKLHFVHFFKFKKNDMKNFFFKVKDSCRIDNGRIIPARVLETIPGRRNISNIASFIPAAGSATRFSSQNTSQHKNSSDENPLAKALFPCVEEGHNFLEMKFMEQKAINRISTTICVIPLNRKKCFLEKFGETFEDQKILFLEQNAQLSTLRFNEWGEPLLQNGSLSIAPAGHGSLLQLFPHIKAEFPNIEALFIRNIDNIIGCKKEAVLTSQRFLDAHQFVLSKVKKIRYHLASRHLKLAASEANSICHYFPLRKLSSAELSFLKNLADPVATPLWLIQLALFQTPLKLCVMNIQNPLNLYQRPLNFLGQVPNSGNDQGGMPLVIEGEYGEQAVCLENTHLDEADRARLTDPLFATHFNPVFVVTELQSSNELYQQLTNAHWLFAARQWKGQTSYHYESLLYEMLGNSVMANLVFMEVPRSIFNPHKSLEDTANRSLADWT